jgi:hypothetical protein
LSPLTPDQLSVTIERLRRMRYAITLRATPGDDGSLVPMLTASAEVCALDTAIRLLERELKAVAS